MEFDVLGLPEDGPTLDLDHREFAYAGNFVMSNTGKAVVREDGAVVGAVAFNEDRTDSSTIRLRYVTVRDDRQGNGIGTRLLRDTARFLTDWGYKTVSIAANNPIAYQACYRAGFVFTGEETGIAELSLRYDPGGKRSKTQYQSGLDIFRDRSLPESHSEFLDGVADSDPPPIFDE